MQKQRIVLLGPPASGKGTQADLIASAYGIPHVSTGALLRSESSRRTDIGLEADSWISKGLLVPDELVIRIVTTWIEKNGSTFLYDGFPRSVSQAEYLNHFLDSLKAPLDLIIVLELADKEIRRRINDRLSCLQCGATCSGKLDALVEGAPCPRCRKPLVRRNDDTDEAIERRLEIYRELTMPVVDYYNRTSSELVRRIDAEVGSQSVFTSISKLIS